MTNQRSRAATKVRRLADPCPVANLQQVRNSDSRIRIGTTERINVQWPALRRPTSHLPERSTRGPSIASFDYPVLHPQSRNNAPTFLSSRALRPLGFISRMHSSGKSKTLAISRCADATEASLRSRFFRRDDVARFFAIMRREIMKPYSMVQQPDRSASSSLKRSERVVRLQR